MAGSALRRLMAEYKRKQKKQDVSSKSTSDDAKSTAGHNMFAPYYKLPPGVKLVKKMCGLSLIAFTYFLVAADLFFAELTLNPPEGIIAGPINEENFFEWEALIAGPEGTCFEGGVFPAKLIFPPDYPLSPPKMQFICDMFHPNIYADGSVCISILHAPGDDPMGYESSAERWSPVQSVEKILLSVVSMLAEPNDESGANVDAAKMWREDREQFNKIAEDLVRMTLGLPSN